MRTTLLLLALGALGCKPTDIDSGPKGSDTDESDVDTDVDSDTDADPGAAPVVEEADAYCLLNDSSETYYYWIVQCAADDPQGADTLAAFGDEWEHTVTVTNDQGAELASYVLSCDNDGDCTGTFYESDAGVICTSASSYSFGFVVYDQDGNASQPFVVVGRQG
jgi:hypothetical protein